jgi:HlyD family secretion protein
MKKGMKIGIAVVVIGGITALSAIAVKKNRAGAGIEVRMEPVTQRDLVATVSASGWIRPHKYVDVQADIMGRIIELNTVEGANVRRGQLLVRVDPTQYQAAVGRSQAAVSEALAREAQTKANLAQAQRAYDRLKKLASDNNLVSQQQLEEAETQLRVQNELLVGAGFGVAQARSALEEAQDMLSKTVIRAPMDGVVTRLNVEEGSTAIVGTTNNPGSILLTIADLSAMEAVVRVDETDLPDIHIADSVEISIDAFPRQKFTGRVTEIGFSSVRSPLQNGGQPAAANQAIDYEIVIALDNPPASLRSDLSVSADIVTAKRPKTLSIPIIALTVREQDSIKPLANENAAAQAAGEAAAKRDDKGDREGVFVVRGGKAVFVPVKVGIAGTEHFEVISGLTTKDTVVAGPYEAIRSLEDGKAVRPMPAAVTPAANSTKPKGS